jgi:trehalose utilization protein
MPQPNQPTQPIRVTVWGENVHEHRDESVRTIYPDGMHTTIAEGIAEHLGDGAVVRTATLDQPEHGLTEEVLAETDVLTWWGHAAHQDVSDEIVARVRSRVLAGMGLLVLHSAHFSKIFIDLMGSTCSLGWRNEADRELVWTVAPGHPITAGVPNPIDIPEQEMYSEYFDIPAPEELVFISSFTGGEVFRSGCTFRRGNGRIFYFSPGDQEYPVYHHPHVRRVLANAVGWAAPGPAIDAPTVANRPRGWFEA